MISVGVDPGKNGGFAVLVDGRCACAKKWDDVAFIAAMQEVSSKPVSAIRVCVEKVGAMPHQGVTSMFSFGKSAGFIEGVLQAYGIPYQLVPPYTWKKEFGLTSDKQKSVDVCRRLFPEVSLLPTSRCTKPSDGIGEALLMAEYARRKL
jgi:crossover junction endodeoxyribonuclease RuvC